MEEKNNLCTNSSSSLTIKRNLGIDFLRVLSTIMIVALHVLSQGGILKAAGVFTLSGETLWFLQILCYGAVNTFALISGYVGLEAKHKLSSLIVLWFQVVFYSALSELAINLFFADGVSVVNIVKVFLPVSTEQNWYFSAYFIVFLLMPLLNQIVEKVEKKILDSALIAVAVFYIVLGTIININVLGVNSGYSVIWIALLYLLGAYIKKYEPLKKITPHLCALGFLGCALITFLSRLVIELATWKITGVPSLGTKFITYTSPFMVLQAMFALQLFSKWNLPKVLVKTTVWFVPMSFGVFVIHTSTAIYRYILKDAFLFTEAYPLPLVITIAFVVVIAIFLLCSIIDFGRIHLFKLCRINKLSVSIEKMLKNSDKR